MPSLRHDHASSTTCTTPARSGRAVRTMPVLRNISIRVTDSPTNTRDEALPTPTGRAQSRSRQVGVGASGSWRFGSPADPVLRDPTDYAAFFDCNDRSSAAGLCVDAIRTVGSASPGTRAELFQSRARTPHSPLDCVEAT